MNQLERTISSVEVAKQVGKRHADLMKDIRTYIGYLAEGKVPPGDFFIEATYLDSNNQERPSFDCTKQGCEMIGNKMIGKKGVQFTAFYVQQFNKMESHIKAYPMDSYMIEDPAARAQKWIEEYQEKQQAYAIIEEQRPKVIFANAVEVAEDSVNVKVLATTLKKHGIDIGQNRLFRWLREHGYLSSKNGTTRNLPNQRALDRGLFELQLNSYYDSKSNSHRNRYTTMVTGKGQIYFVNLFLKNKDVHEADTTDVVQESFF
ncbi:phage regulatory protein/antirepressor Ant [Listeria newyorkensis]|uniref:Permease n=1 Tax=Listeria newyorkensis TaxID=1497681 RepID=A0A841Z2R6_9LIST|nr:phage regulatory protein/antirepressor Ant [Listeria newyorkensis]MBC1459123.1 permease [Listeria newyorkensis]